MYYGFSADTFQKMYVKGSLQNRSDGFVFQIKNLIDSGSVSGIGKLMVDGEEKPLEGVTVEVGGKVHQVSQLSWASSLYVSYGAVLTIYAPGALAPGEHTVTLVVSAPELGSLNFPITDTVA